MVADNSAVNLIEDSHSGSLLGDDFGHLHQDYTVKGKLQAFIQDYTVKGKQQDFTHLKTEVILLHM